MQTMHDRSLDWMNRGHHHAATVDAITRSRGRGFEIGVHIILGLPGESREDMQATALRAGATERRRRQAAQLVRRAETRLGRASPRRHGATAATRRVRAQRRGRDRTATTAHGRPAHRRAKHRASTWSAPTWCLDKAGLRLAIEQEFERRHTYQGTMWSPADPRCLPPVPRPPRPPTDSAVAGA